MATIVVIHAYAGICHRTGARAAQKDYLSLTDPRPLQQCIEHYGAFHKNPCLDLYGQLSVTAGIIGQL